MRWKGSAILRRKKHTGIIIVSTAAAIIAASLAVYCVHAERYRDTFIEGTYINGIDAGGMKASEVEAVIKNRVEDYDLKLIFHGGQTEVLSASDIGFSYSSDKGITRLMSIQNPYEWILGKLGVSSSFTVGEAYTYNEDMLKEAVLSLPEFSEENVIKARNACMKMSDDNRLIVVPEIDGNELRSDVVLDALRTAVAEGQRTIDVTSLENAYVTADVRSDDEALNAQVNDLNTYLDVVVTYDMYDDSRVVVDRKQIARWLSVREDDPNYYYLNTDVLQAKCEKYLKIMSTKYDKTYNTLSFHSTNRGDLVLPTETTGYLIDEAGEAAELYRIILSRQSEEREPLYTLHTTPYGTLSTYVEVDIQNQHVYYYRNGSLALDSACVTGKQTDSSRRTPTGVFSIIEMDTARTLRGEPNAAGQPSYESFVNYWMRFYEGCGLHDASWRSNFGGDIYINSGSHGCVNMPYNAARELYGMVEYGTPVIVI